MWVQRTASSGILTLSLHDARPIFVPTKDWTKLSKFPDIVDYPDLGACVGCHRRQFFKGARPPICSVCQDRESTRLNSSHLVMSYAVFCMRKTIDVFTNSRSLVGGI